MKSGSDQDTTFDFWLDEAEHPFSGWDFSHIIESGRMVTGAVVLVLYQRSASDRAPKPIFTRHGYRWR